MNPLFVQFKNLKLKSPLMTASGTSGHGDGTSVLKNRDKIISSLGAFITKGVTIDPREGNREFRIAEIRSGVGIINAIGLQNKGAEFFLRNELPEFLNIDLPIIVNIAANSVEEYGKLASYLSKNDESLCFNLRFLYLRF